MPCSNFLWFSGCVLLVKSSLCIWFFNRQFNINQFGLPQLSTTSLVNKSIKGPPFKVHAFKTLQSFCCYFISIKLYQTAGWTSSTTLSVHFFRAKSSGLISPTLVSSNWFKVCFLSQQLEWCTEAKVDAYQLTFTANGNVKSHFLRGSWLGFILLFHHSSVHQDQQNMAQVHNDSVRALHLAKATMWKDGTQGLV